MTFQKLMKCVGGKIAVSTMAVILGISSPAGAMPVIASNVTSEVDDVGLRTTVPTGVVAGEIITEEEDKAEPGGVLDALLEELANEEASNQSPNTGPTENETEQDTDSGGDIDTGPSEGEPTTASETVPAESQTESPPKDPTAPPNDQTDTESTTPTPEDTESTTPTPEDTESVVPTETPGEASVTEVPEQDDNKDESTETSIETSAMEVVAEESSPQKTDKPKVPIPVTPTPAAEKGTTAEEIDTQDWSSENQTSSYAPWTSYSYTVPTATGLSSSKPVDSGFYLAANAKKMTLSNDKHVGDRLNVREAPDINSRIVGALYRGSICYDIDNQNDPDYAYIEAVDADGHIIRGYVYREYIREITASEARRLKESETNVKRIISESYNKAFFDNRLTTQKSLLTVKTEVRAGIREDIIKDAEQYLGNPYVWGGEDLINGCDCSGFTKGIYNHFGYELPRCSYEQAEVGTKISLNDLQIGDLVFYARDGVVYHVMIYHGTGPDGRPQVIHASSSTTGIIISNLNTDRFCWGVRIIDDAPATISKASTSHNSMTQAKSLMSDGKLAYMGNTAAQESVIEKLSSSASVAAAKTGFKFPSILIAQAIQESGWISFSNPVEGGIQPEDNNILGMNTDLNGYPTSYYASGSVDRVVPQWNGYGDVWGFEPMRTYSSIEDCLADFANFRVWMHPELSDMENDYDAYLSLAVKGYATDPTYEDSLRSIISRYNLRNYDNTTPVVTDTIDTQKFQEDAKSANTGDNVAREAVIETIGEAAYEGWNTYGIAPSLLAAVAVTNDWATTMESDTNNLYSVEADESWTGDVVEATRTVINDKTIRQETVGLKQYDSLTEACMDFAASLAEEHPELVGLVDEEELAAFIAPEDAETITKTYEENNLGRLDIDPMFKDQGSGVVINAVDNTAYTQEELELIWAIVAQEDDQSYEGALAVISSAMNRADANYGGYGTTALAQLTADGQYCYSPKVSDPSLWQRRLGGNVPEDVKRAVEDCLTKGIRNNSYLNFRSTSREGSVQLGENFYF